MLELFGVWCIVLLTLSIFSYLYGDNPFYKAAEHIFVGVSAGYIFTITFWDTIWPNLFGRLIPSYVQAGFEFDISYLFPLFLGIFMLFRLSKKYDWLSRISIAYIVGMMAGLKFYVFLNSNLLTQIKSSTVNLSGSYFSIVNEVIILIGVISGLVYFFFSKEHTGVVGKVSRVGVYFLMIKFGASFGFAVMGRISLLIGRFEELIDYSNVEYFYATPIILIFMIIVLTYWSFTNKDLKENN
ncbi:MAG: hypothetical protein CMG39_03755 [Candidatus Marinimicrobia bacterium]|nr:hypothetical protein [Candidatus Neomarinimicrobiota bacterium]|tara:strand:+ start:5616 stop:6338 length:723 start_codon:yes stop_codon:yes gene_type:complete